MARGGVLTVPNLVTFVRLAGVPLFLYLFLGPQLDGWAVVVLVVGGTSDWIDGFLARRLGQTSALGELLDPLADRLYILATLIAFTVRDIVPLWFTLALVLREVVVAVCLLVVRRYGYQAFNVHYVGKAATFLLLFAFPTVLLADTEPGAAGWAYPVGWSLALWGIVLYWIAALFYVVQAARVVREANPTTARPA
jgi:cardiolipin synthase (CMP-forming)